MMSLPGNYITVNNNNSSPVEENKAALSLPCSGRNSDNRKERSVDEFLNGIIENNIPANDEECKSDSITIKVENSHHSSLMSRPHSEIPNDLEDDKFETENDDQNHEIINNSIHSNSKSDESISKRKPEVVDNEANVSLSKSNKSKDLKLNDGDKIATPTITFRKHLENVDTQIQDMQPLNSDIKKSSEYEEFSDKLSQMTILIQQKDEEIKKLLEKLKEIESKNKYSKKSSSSSSSFSLSSDENDKSSDIINKSKKKSKPKNKKTEKIGKKNKSKNVDKKAIDSEILHFNSMEKSNNNAAEQDENLISNGLVSYYPSQSLKNNTNQPEMVDKPVSIADESLNFKSMSTEEISHDKTTLVTDLRKKLDGLEIEVRRLQQANVDSIITFQKLQDNSTNDKESSNNVVINKLLVDHSVLKEELQQLKWEHSKLTQPALLVDEINQLKFDMNCLRKQNEFLKKFSKQSSQSLNHLSNTGYDIKDSREKFDLKPKDSNNSSNYIYQKLQKNHRTITDTPTMHTLLKHNIDSFESPYHSTCQSIQYSTPFSGGQTYRARKVSDTSSILVEDIKPKTWVETVPKLYNTSYHQFSPSHQYQHNPFSNKDEDQQSVESYVSVTTSVTERTEENWRPDYRNDNESNNDLLSTQDSEFSEYNIVKQKSKLKFGNSFTPKTPKDLNLEDHVKFVRPGGKMATGRVCFIGHLPGRNEVCVGLELEEEAGKHDGLFEGTRYFHCRKNRGVFISFHKIILAYESI